MSPQRMLQQGTRAWVELPNGFGRHGVTILQADTLWTSGVDMLEVSLLVTHIPESEAGELADVGSLECGRVVDLSALGRWQIIRVSGDLGWEPHVTKDGSIRGGIADHWIRLRLRPEGARYL